METQIFLIPEGYVGTLKVIYGVSGSSPAEYEGDARVVQFNGQGGHATELEAPSGRATRDTFQFFYVDKNQKRTAVLLSDLVRFEEFSKEVTDPNVYIISVSTGSYGTPDCAYSTKTYFVGTYKNTTEGEGHKPTEEYDNLMPCVPAPVKKSTDAACTC